MKQFLIIGDQGYIGTNLKLKLSDKSLNTFNRSDKLYSLEKKIAESDVIFHLASVQKPKNNQSYEENLAITKSIIDIINSHKSKTIVFSSSIHAESNNAFGNMKLKEEQYIKNNIGENTYKIIRIPNTYGPHSRPNYNNVFSTFATAVENSQPVYISNPNHVIKMISINEVIEIMKNSLYTNENSEITIIPDYETTLSNLLNMLVEIRNGSAVQAPQNLIESAMFYIRT